MGMFDTITCELLLPDLPQELIQKWGGSELIGFQTKSIDNALDLFKINENGELLRKKVHRELISEGDPDAESIIDRLPQWNTVDCGWEATKFNGEVIFYDYYDYEEKTDRSGWVDYKAIFLNGLLQGQVEQIKHRIPRNHTQEELDQIQKRKDEWAARRKEHNDAKIQIIEEYKSKIKELSKMQDFIYQNLLEKINVKESDSIEEWIFDHVYNDNHYSIERIKEYIWI